MTDGSGAASARYRAFISYSHRDAVFAARLHRRLETYVLPKRLGAERRLTPIFKDREELPAAHDLSAQVRAALAVSDCLIVVCSPDAAASPWVGREIALFRELQPGRPILAALVRGEPAEAFPAAISYGGAEPLAADFRKEGDGGRLALLKLVAGIAGLGVDQLVQRDAQRRLRAVMAVTGVAVGAMLAMSATTMLALDAQAQAEQRRIEAEKLVEFMLKDLRGQLKDVGSLPIMAAVNRQALAYFASQDLTKLPADSLDLRARLLLAMGEDDATRGDLEAAVAQFDEANRVTSKLVAATPNNPDRLFSHAQSIYWRGNLNYRRKKTKEARQSFEAYRIVALQLARIEPGSLRSIQEIAHAEGNLCSLALTLERELDRALAACQSALEGMRRALDRKPENPELTLDVATRLAWLADVQVELGDFAGAEENRRAQAAFLQTLLARTPESAVLQDNWGICQRGLALIAYRQGRVPEARVHLQTAQQTFRRLIAIDPANTRWREQLAFADRVMPVLDAELRRKSLQ